MSIKYLAYAFDARVNNPLRKLVLLKLCDNANDSGECWPSFQHIADQCEISRRSAINHIQALVDSGILVSEARFKSGEQTTNMYKISKEKLIGGGESAAPPSEPPAPHPVQELHPPSAGAAPPSEPPAPHPVQELHPPSAGAAPRTVIEPSIRTVKESLPKLLADFDYSSWPEKPDQQIFSDWVLMRKAKKGSFSQTVIDGFGDEFRKAIPFGYSVNDCLKAAIMSNWTGFKFNWLQNQNAGGSNGKGGIGATGKKSYGEQRAELFDGLTNYDKATNF